MEDVPLQKTERPVDEWLEALIRRWMSGFKTKILAGLTVIAPLWVTFWALRTIFNWADGISAPLVQQLFGIHIPGLGLILTCILLWIIGVLATNVLGTRLLHWSRNLLGQLPIVRMIHGPVHQLLETITSPNKTGFKRVVLVEYPRQGIWRLGFVAGDIPSQCGGMMVHSVFVPNTPNLTSGFTFIVPPEQLRPTDMSVEEAFQMIISGGIVVPRRSI
jgi:uncharacterized membrane protein